MAENKVQNLMELLKNMIDNSNTAKLDQDDRPPLEEFIVPLDQCVQEEIKPTLPTNTPLSETEEMVQNLRKLGNYAFRKQEVTEAINLFNIAIELTKHSPVMFLFNSRAMCFMELESFKRAVIDCDFVIGKLDEKNLNAWLFRAKSYFALNANLEYTKSISEAKKNNPKKVLLIEEVVKEIHKMQLT